MTPILPQPMRPTQARRDPRPTVTDCIHGHVADALPAIPGSLR